VANDITMLNQSNVPAHIAKFLEDNSNITGRDIVPSLLVEGKVWTVSIDGTKTPLMRKDEDGDLVPVATFSAVILDYAKRRGRTYYLGGYDKDNPGKPVCWSADGVTPNASVTDKQSERCGSCPQAVKGAKISNNGKPVTPCDQHRMLAVVPASKLDMTPLRLKIAITSDYDAQIPDLNAQGWFAFSGYTDILRARGYNHTAALVTKIKFDANASYPKLLFSPARWLTDAEIAVVNPVTKSAAVTELLSGSWTPTGGDGEKIVSMANALDKLDKPTVSSEKKAAPIVKPTAPLDDDDADEKIVIDQPALPVAKLKVPTKKPAPAPAAIEATLPDDIASLLNEWGDD
jgi:hypothetical protein